IIGDSQVFCGERPFHTTFMARLQRLFDQRGLPIEIVPMGVNNYSTAQEYLVYHLIGKKLKPDLVIVMFFVGNDLFNNMGPCDERPCFRIKDGRLVKPPFRRRDLNTGPVRDWLRRHVRLYTLLPNLVRQLGQAFRHRRRQARRVSATSKKPPEQRPGWDEPTALTRLMFRAVDLLDSGDSRLMYATTDLSTWWAAAYAVTFKLLAKWDAEVRADGGRLVVVDVPWYDQMYDDRYALALKGLPLWLYPAGTWDRFNVQRRFTAWSRRTGVPFYNLAAAMRREIIKKGTQFFDGLHFVDQGHEFAANFLAGIIGKYYRVRRGSR
ncbi:MAG: SGNH/GDSL hydrolase family protein, partial [Proteobacteria bacterium]|nr:SGNH/GDSL hydrolase family protein [Pseudomonadota bacterium]